MLARKFSAPSFNSKNKIEMVVVLVDRSGPTRHGLPKSNTIKKRTWVVFNINYHY